MRALIVTVVLLVAGRAQADGVDLVAKLGFRVGYGPMSFAHRSVSATSIEIGVEHPVFGNTRVFGEWEWMWLSERDPDQAMAIGREPTHGSGQRVSAGLRHALIAKSHHEMAWYLDGELGGGAMLASEDTLGTHAVPTGIVGMRLGFDFRNGDSTSRVFETEILVRALVTPRDGTGLLVGVGMLWGD